MKTICLGNMISKQLGFGIFSRLWSGGLSHAQDCFVAGKGRILANSRVGSSSICLVRASLRRRIL